jgi:hypothetical protein
LITSLSHDFWSRCLFATVKTCWLNSWVISEIKLLIYYKQLWSNSKYEGIGNKTLWCNIFGLFFCADYFNYVLFLLKLRYVNNCQAQDVWLKFNKESSYNLFSLGRRIFILTLHNNNTMCNERNVMNVIIHVRNNNSQFGLIQSDRSYVTFDIVINLWLCIAFRSSYITIALNYLKIYITHQPAPGPRGELWPVLIIHKEALCPSRGH